MKHLINRFLLLLFVGAASVSCINDDESEPGTVDLVAGDTLPTFSVTMNDGRTVTGESLRGKTSLVVFFYTKCKDCQHELPVVQRIYEDYPEVPVICISREEGAASIAAYWQEHSLTLPYSAQEDRTVYHLFAKSGVPRVYVIDSGLIIRRVFTDNPLAGYEELVSAIESN